MADAEVKASAEAVKPKTQAQAAPEENDASAPSTRQTLDEADRSMALKQWSKAADLYGVALEDLSSHYAEDSPTLAPIHHRYGRCLLEHAIATSGALGGGGGSNEAPMPSRKAEASASGSKPAAADPRFSFGGDADDDDEEEEDGAEQQDGEDGDDADDLGTAFTVLDLARIIYQKVLRGENSSDDESAVDTEAKLETINGQTWNWIKIKNDLADVLNDLGDVGLESENFQQASSDYESCLQLLSPMLHPHSRRLADAYLRLGLALEFHPDPERQTTASRYVRSAANTLRTRLEALEARKAVLSKGDEEEAKKQANAARVREEKALEESVKDRAESTTAAVQGEDSTPAALPGAKGKGKAVGSALEQPKEKDDVADMDSLRVERELKDVKEMLEELEVKLEEEAKGAQAAQSSNGSAGTAEAGGKAIPDAAKAALQQAINDAFLGISTNAPGGLGSSTVSSGAVNDLSGMVKRKKRPAAEESETANSTAKDAPKSAEKESAPPSSENSGAVNKKAKVEDEAAEQ